MRRATLITIICLFVILGIAALYQMAIASNDGAHYPGPVAGTPLPGSTASP